VANVKITQLTADTNPASTDVLPFVDISSNETKKVTIADLLENAGEGSAVSPSFSFDVDDNTGMYRAGPDTLAFATNGGGRLFISSAGNVGFGTSVPDAAAHLRADGNDLKSLLFVQNRNGGANAGVQISLSGALNDLSENRLAYIRGLNTGSSQNGTHLAFGTNPNGGPPEERMRISSTGNVGIGSTSPGNTLHLSGANGVGMRIENTSNSISAYSTLESNGALQANISGAGVFSWVTGGGEKVRIDNSGRLLVGVSTTSADATAVFEDNSASNGPSIVYLSSSSTTPADSAGLGLIRFSAANHSPTAQIAARRDNGTWTAGSSQPSKIEFSTTGDGASSPSVALTINRNGMLGINETNPGHYIDMNIGSNDIGMKMTSTDAGSFIQFADNGTSGETKIGCEGNEFVFDVNGSEKVRLDSSGRLGLGTTTPSTYNANLAVYSAGGAFTGVLHSNTSGSFPKASAISLGSDAVAYTYTTNGTTVALTGSAHIAALQNASSGATTDIAFLTTVGGSVSEKGRIDGSGRLLLGTSTALTSPTGSRFQLSGTDFATSSIRQTRYQSDIPGASLILSHARGTEASPTILNNGDELGKIRWNAYDGTDFECVGAEIKASIDGTIQENQSPSRLEFSTTKTGASSSTERIRINNYGRLSTFSEDGTAFIHASSKAAGTSDRLLEGRFGATAVNGGTKSIEIFTNGDVKNDNDSYGGTSDVKLKENIVDANSQWDDFKAVRFRKYNFKEETGKETFTQLGVIAQELETICPGLVTESPDLDEEGNDLGTTTKGVKYSILTKKALVALQEAMTRIETLEAEVAALKAQ
jgi:hypothetical protein